MLDDLNLNNGYETLKRNTENRSTWRKSNRKKKSFKNQLYSI